MNRRGDSEHGPRSESKMHISMLNSILKERSYINGLTEFKPLGRGLECDFEYKILHIRPEREKKKI